MLDLPNDLLFVWQAHETEGLESGKTSPPTHVQKWYPLVLGSAAAGEVLLHTRVSSPEVRRNMRSGMREKLREAEERRLPASDVSKEEEIYVDFSCSKVTKV